MMCQQPGALPFALDMPNTSNGHKRCAGPSTAAIGAEVCRETAHSPNTALVMAWLGSTLAAKTALTEALVCCMMRASCSTPLACSTPATAPPCPWTDVSEQGLQAPGRWRHDEEEDQGNALWSTRTCIVAHLALTTQQPGSILGCSSVSL